MSLKLSKETEQRLLASIKSYFAERHDEDIGELKAALLLDFIMKEISPIIYNQAITDAQKYMYDKLADLDSSCYEREFGYWEK